MPGPVLVAPKISRNYARARRVAFIRAYRQFVFGKLQKAENWTNAVQFCPTPDKCSTILGFWYYNYRADVSDRPPIWEVISK